MGSHPAATAHRYVPRRDNVPTDYRILPDYRVPLKPGGRMELVARCVSQGWLRFATELAGVVEGVDVLFIAVGTPQGDDGAADLSSVGAVARSVGRALAEAA